MLVAHALAGCAAPPGLGIGLAAPVGATMRLSPGETVHCRGFSLAMPGWTMLVGVSSMTADAPGRQELTRAPDTLVEVGWRTDILYLEWDTPDPPHPSAIALWTVSCEAIRVRLGRVRTGIGWHVGFGMASETETCVVLGGILRVKPKASRTALRMQCGCYLTAGGYTALVPSVGLEWSF